MKSYNKNSRGQAALEFMMTYGWAILVVLAAIGALSYFGVLNPARFTPDTCLASAPFSCPGKPIVSASSNTVTYSLINGQGYNVVINTSAALLNNTGSLLACPNANAYVCSQGNVTCTLQQQIVPPGQGITVRLTGCTTGTAIGSLNIVKGDSIFTYNNPESRLSEQILVSVTAKPR